MSKIHTIMIYDGFELGKIYQNFIETCSGHRRILELKKFRAKFRVNMDSPNIRDTYIEFETEKDKMAFMLKYS
jgi:hypothetical protein